MLEQGPADDGGAAGAAPHTRPPGSRARPPGLPPPARGAAQARAPAQRAAQRRARPAPSQGRAARAGRAPAAQDAAAAALQRFCRGALHECITQARRQRARKSAVPSCDALLSLGPVSHIWPVWRGLAWSLLACAHAGSAAVAWERLKHGSEEARSARCRCSRVVRRGMCRGGPVSVWAGLPGCSLGPCAASTGEDQRAGPLPGRPCSC